MVPPIDQPEDHAALSDALRSFFLRSHRIFDRLLQEQGASIARFKMLTFIESEAEARSTDIARAFGHSPRTVTEAIDALERDGLIRREADPHDRRAKRLMLTDAGRAAIAAVAPIRERLTRSLYGALDAGERTLLTGFLNRLDERLRAIEDDLT